MTWDEWEENYSPLGHPEGESHGLEIDGVACLIETYETDLIGRIHPHHLWTMLDDPSGRVFVVAGRHDDDDVPVIGYVQTALPWTRGDESTEPEGVADIEDEDDDDTENDEEY